MFQYFLLIALPVLVLAQESLKPYDETATDLFDAIDLDRNGIIVGNEAHIYYLRFDANGNHQVTIEEFTNFIDQQSPHFRGHENALFAKFDVNSDNIVTEIDVNDLFFLIDHDSNGQINEHEFVSYWAKIFEALDSYAGPGR